MNFFFLDASALPKRYFPEPGSVLMHHLFGNVAKPRFGCLMFGAAEVVAVLVRKRNAGRIDQISFSSALLTFRSEVIDAVDFAKHPADNLLVRRAIDLLLKHPINSTDGLLLQIVLELAGFERSQGNDYVLLASDQRLLKAARAEGILTFDPETQTQTDLDNLIGP